MKNIIIFLALIAILSCSKTTTQTPFAHNASINGYVSFENANPDTLIADINLFEQSQGIKISSTTSDNIGYFEFTGISSGTYQIQIQANGFEDKYVANIALQSHQITSLDTLQMELIRPIEFKEITIDGVIDEGWESVYQNQNTSNWSSSNDFANLYLARDNDSLYIAVDGGFDSTSGNSVNIYIDTDCDKNTGIADFSQISGGAIGSNLNKDIDVSVDFGADVAFSEKDLANDIAAVSLENPATVDENIISANISLNSSVIEMAIPLNQIYPDGNIPAKIALVAIIGGGDAQSFANDSIPQQTGGFVGTFNSVFTRNY